MDNIHIDTGLKNSGAAKTSSARDLAAQGLTKQVLDPQAHYKEIGTALEEMNFNNGSAIYVNACMPGHSGFHCNGLIEVKRTDGTKVNYPVLSTKDNKVKDLRQILTDIRRILNDKHFKD